MRTYKLRNSFFSNFCLIVNYVHLSLFGCMTFFLWMVFLVAIPKHTVAESICLIPFFLMIPWIAWGFLKSVWRELVFGERWTIYVQTWNSLAVLIPGHAPYFIRRADCIAFAPRTATVTLRSGVQVRLPGNPYTEKPLPMAETRKLIWMCRTLLNRKRIQENDGSFQLPSANHLMVVWFPTIEDELGKSGFSEPRFYESLASSRFLRDMSLSMILAATLGVALGFSYFVGIFIFSGWVVAIRTLVEHRLFRSHFHPEIELIPETALESDIQWAAES